MFNHWLSLFHGRMPFDIYYISWDSYKRDFNPNIGNITYLQINYINPLITYTILSRLEFTALWNNVTRLSYLPAIVNKIRYLYFYRASFNITNVYKSIAPSEDRTCCSSNHRSWIIINSSEFNLSQDFPSEDWFN